jgi:hypothetical protein
MNFNVALVNPRTGEQRTILIELSQQQAADAKGAPCLQSFVQAKARAAFPDGFMPLGNGVAAVTLQ